MAKTGALEPEKCKFLLEHTDTMIQYLHLRYIRIILSNHKATDNEFIYVVGVIKDPHAQAATNGIEYEQEKMFLRNMKLYSFWEALHEPGEPAKSISEEIDYLYSLSLKK
jgi:hypothetical protein